MVSLEANRATPRSYSPPLSRLMVEPFPIASLSLGHGSIAMPCHGSSSHAMKAGMQRAPRGKDACLPSIEASSQPRSSLDEDEERVL
jgi:hypothetical protein